MNKETNTNANIENYIDEVLKEKVRKLKDIEDFEKECRHIRNQFCDKREHALDQIEWKEMN